MNKLSCKSHNNISTTSSTTSFSKPFQKWVGGKTQIIDTLNRPKSKIRQKNTPTKLSYFLIGRKYVKI